MDAKKRVTCTLRVEWLESRCLLAGAGLVYPVAAHALNPGALTDSAQMVHAAAPLASAPANASHTTAPYGTSGPDGDDADDDDPAASTTIATRTVDDGHPGGRIQLPGTDPTEQYPDGREREMENHTVFQLARTDSHTFTVPSQPTPVPANQSGSLLAIDVGSRGTNEDHPEIAARPAGELVSALLAARAPGINEMLPIVAELPGAAPLSASGPGCGPGAPAGSAAAARDRVIPGASEIAGDPNPPGWRSVLLDPLAGIPLRDAVALDLATLGTEAEALFAHLANLGPEWAAGAEWTEYVCFAAGVLLVGGGAYFARTAGARTGPARVPLAPREDAP
jgi:hypothetical protein